MRDAAAVEIQQLEAKVKEAKAEVKEAEAEVKEAEAKVEKAKAEAKIAELEAKIAELEAKIAELEAQDPNRTNESVQRQIKQLQGQIVVLQGQIEQLMRGVAADKDAVVERARERRLAAEVRGHGASASGATDLRRSGWRHLSGAFELRDGVTYYPFRLRLNLEFECKDVRVCGTCERRSSSTGGIVYAYEFSVMEISVGKVDRIVKDARDLSRDDVVAETIRHEWRFAEVPSDPTEWVYSDPSPTSPQVCEAARGGAPITFNRSRGGDSAGWKPSDGRRERPSSSVDSPTTSHDTTNNAHVYFYNKYFGAAKKLFGSDGWNAELRSTRDTQGGLTPESIEDLVHKLGHYGPVMKLTAATHKCYDELRFYYAWKFVPSGSSGVWDLILARRDVEVDRIPRDVRGEEYFVEILNKDLDLWRQALALRKHLTLAWKLGVYDVAAHIDEHVSAEETTSRCWAVSSADVPDADRVRTTPTIYETPVAEPVDEPLEVSRNVARKLLEQ